MFFSHRQIRLDPTPTDGGGSTEPTTPPAPSTLPASVPPPSDGGGGQPDKVTISLQDYTALIGLKTKAERAAEDLRNEKLLAEAESGNGKKALKDLDDHWKAKFEAVQSQIRTQSVEAALTTAISAAGVTFRSAPAQAQAIQLLRSDLVVRSNPDGSVSVVDGKGRDATEAVSAKLKSEEFAHFIAATAAGGSPAAGSHRPSPTPTGDGTPKDLTPAEQALDTYFRGIREQVQKTGMVAGAMRVVPFATQYLESRNGSSR